MRGRRLFPVIWVMLGSLLVEGCMGTYHVRFLKAREMIQDMETIALDQPDHPSGLPETGILVRNHTDVPLLVEMRGKGLEERRVPPGGSASMALLPGRYYYRVSRAETGDGKTEPLYIPLEGNKRIVEKCLYIYDVSTREEIVDGEELKRLRAR